jgi:hypothetical protein
VEEPRVQHAPGGNVAVGAGGVRREGQGAPIGAGLHVGADQPHLAVGRVLHGGGALEGPEGLDGVAPGEGRFTALQPLGALWLGPRGAVTAPGGGDGPEDEGTGPEAGAGGPTQPADRAQGSRVMRGLFRVGALGS